MGNTNVKGDFSEVFETCLNGTISADDANFWNKLFNSPLCLQDEKIHLSFSAIRKARRHFSPNFNIFFVKVLEQLNHIIHRGNHNLITSEDCTTALTCVRLMTRVMAVLLEVPFPGISGHLNNEVERCIDQNVGIQQNDTPDKMEHDSYSDASSQRVYSVSADLESEFVYSLLWESGMSKQCKDQGLPMEIHDFNDIEQEDDAVLGVQILTTLQKLLFLNGFTVIAPGVTQNESYPKHRVDTRYLWKGGIGALKDTPGFGNSTIYLARTTVLRCLLTCLSSTLFISVEEYQYSPPPLWLWVFTRGSLPYTANLYCSLMSTVFSYDPPTGYGLGYGQLFSSGIEDELVTISLQLLCVLMDFNVSLVTQHPTAPTTSPLLKNGQPGRIPSPSSEELSLHGTGNSPLLNDIKKDNSVPVHLKDEVENGVVEHTDTLRNTQPTVNHPPDSSILFRNAFRLMLSGMKRDLEIDLVFNSIVRLLKSVMKSKTSYLFRQSQFMYSYQELLLLLWHIMTINPLFLTRVLSRLNANHLLVPLLFLLLETSTRIREASNQQQQSTHSIKQQHDSHLKLNTIDHRRIGLLHLCSFILLILSSEREFSVGLNADFNEAFPLPLPAFKGTHADLIVIISHRLIVDAAISTTNDSLIHMLLTTLCNISAYIKSFCLESCIKLLNLVARFSKPSWLFKAPYHYHDVFFILEILNNAVQYQYEGNLQLVYSILRQKDLFLHLQNLSFSDYSSLIDSPQTINRPQSYTIQSYTDNQLSHLSPHDMESQMKMIPHHLIGEQHLSGKEQDIWTPTEEWFIDWKSKTPLLTLLRLISTLLPIVKTECEEKEFINQEEVLNFLKKTTMVGLLPLPHAIIIRSYYPNSYTALWFTTYTWGVIVSRTQHLVDYKKIRFLTVNELHS